MLTAEECRKISISTPTREAIQKDTQLGAEKIISAIEVDLSNAAKEGKLSLEVIMCMPGYRDSPEIRNAVSGNLKGRVFEVKVAEYGYNPQYTIRW